MEARGAAQPAGDRRGKTGKAPAWLLGLIPLALIIGVIATFALLDGPGLGSRNGPPVEELAIERTELHPGSIELTVRNDGPDAVTISQAMVNDSFVDFTTSDRRIGHLSATKVKMTYPWIEGEAYETKLLTSTGNAVTHTIPVAAETPAKDAGFYGLMALLGLYVGIIPVMLGMLWLPFVGRVGEGVIRILIAVTIGLLGFLAIDATLEGIQVAGEGPKSFGGPALVFLGGFAAYLALTAIAARSNSRREADPDPKTAGSRLALLVAIAIGLHNLGEGLAIGSAYAVGALALGAFLVIGFAIHNTTEGLAIVAPVAERAPSLRFLALLGLVAGGPAIVGAWIGASAFNSSIAAFLLGVGAGAIVQVIQQLFPLIRDRSGSAFQPATVLGMLAGALILYTTSLLVSV
jgi:zinc transporter, ZIP family